VGRYDDLRRKRARPKTILKAVGITLLALVVGVAAVAGVFLYRINQNLHAGLDAGDVVAAIEKSDDVYEGDPFYVLLIGIDRSEGRVESGNYGDAWRSDTLILARVDPAEPQITLVSIPRDTKVEIDGYGTDKINAAHAYGGIDLTMDVVSEFCGVNISYYVEVDFDGFKAAVDALGGIEVDVPIDIDDDHAGGSLSAGLQTLDGKQALILCRSRHAYDDYGDGDMYRAANQRMVIGAMINKALQSDAVTLAGLISTVSEYVETNMDVTEIISIAVAMSDLDADKDIYSATCPTESSFDGTIWYEIVDEDAWKAMMARVDAGEAPLPGAGNSSNTGGDVDNYVSEQEAVELLSDDIDVAQNDSLTGVVAELPEDATIVVWDGCGNYSYAAEATQVLVDAGYDAEFWGTLAYDYELTTVVYNVGSQTACARRLAQVLGVGVVEPCGETYDFSADYLVIIGSNYDPYATSDTEADEADDVASPDDAYATGDDDAEGDEAL